MVQFGFCALFAAAFPLAPLFALLNNLIEVRFDAHKFLVNFRRPVALSSKGIGIWLQILDLLSTIAVFCNVRDTFITLYFMTLYYFMTLCAVNIVF